jgi:hypothetical protein
LPIIFPMKNMLIILGVYQHVQTHPNLEAFCVSLLRLWHVPHWLCNVSDVMRCVTGLACGNKEFRSKIMWNWRVCLKIGFSNIGLLSQSLFLVMAISGAIFHFQTSPQHSVGPGWCPFLKGSTNYPRYLTINHLTNGKVSQEEFYQSIWQNSVRVINDISDD